MSERHTVDSITSDALDQLYDELDQANKAIRHILGIHPDDRVTALEAEVARLRTAPAEHCGNQKPPFSEHTQRTECTLRPGHHGSHADERGARWWWIDDRPATA